MSFLSTSQIQAQVKSIRKAQKNGPQNFAIQYAGEWTGGEYLTVDEVKHLVCPCVSDLQIRESLLRAEEQKRPTILLCSVRAEQLGDDVIDRLAKRRVFAPKERDMLAELFSVASNKIDPRLIKSKTLMNALLEMVPPQGYAPVASGMLDLQTAWLTYLEQLTGDKPESLSLTVLLEWSLDAKIRQRLEDIQADLKHELVDWMVRNKGEASRYMLLAMESKMDLLSLGEALAVVFDPSHSKSADHQGAKVRSERYFQHREIDSASAVSWGRSVRGYCKREAATGKSPFDVKRGQQLDALLGDLGVASSAHLSDYSPTGLDQRYKDAAKALTNALKSGAASGMEPIQGEIERVREHVSGGADVERVSRLEMAFRLICWLNDKDAGEAMAATGNGLPALVGGYHQDGGFVDWARNRLKESDESRAVKKAYDMILEQVDKRTHSNAEKFAVRLEEWTRTEDTSKELILIENVLDEVVIPLAKLRPVLLLVLDGMSVAVMRELLADLTQHGWAEMKQDQEGGLPKPVLAALPSVTAISRKALFMGCLDSTVKGTEETAFKNNDALFQGSKSQARPRLFKQGALTQEGQGGLSDEVIHSVGNKKCRVVGIVLNAIDDELDGGKQVSNVWSRDRIPLLRDALRQAADAGRAVILTSDHGHVLDHGTNLIQSEKDSRGDRYRSCSGAPVEGELVFSGSRVKKALGKDSVTLAWSENIRYGKSKRGYHGGANPQEMVTPMAILTNAADEAPDGWLEVASYQPTWWRAEGTGEVAKVTAPVEKVVSGLELFETVSAQKSSQTGGWIEVLLSSPTYKEQASLAVRGAPDHQVMIKLLSSLENRGGVMVKPALAQELGVPAFRLDGLIQNVGRILNVDGYEVIEFDRSSETIKLDVSLLKKQFEIS